MKNFLGVYYEWFQDAKGTYEKMTVDKDEKNIVEFYDKYAGSDFKVQRTPGDPDMNLIKSDLE